MKKHELYGSAEIVRKRVFEELRWKCAELQGLEVACRDTTVVGSCDSRVALHSQSCSCGFKM